jgi:hypothetical protein
MKGMYMGMNGKLLKSGIEKQHYQYIYNSTKKACQRLIEDGGADYDFEDCNPETIFDVLLGNGAGKVVPKSSQQSIFFAIYSHGDSHPSGPSKDAQPCYFTHMPYSSRSTKIYSFVPTDGSKGNFLNYFYDTQLRVILHELFSRSPERKIVGLLNFCRSGGNLDFMTKPAVVKHLGVDNWPLYLMSSSQAEADSLVGGFWDVYIKAMCEARSEKATLETIFMNAKRLYFQDNAYDILNHIKEVAYCQKIWALDFHFECENKLGDIDPWHLDLKRAILHLMRNEKDGNVSSVNGYNWRILCDLQDAYKFGTAFRVTNKKIEGIDGFADCFTSRGKKYVYWTGNDKLQKYCSEEGLQWGEIPGSKPFPVIVTAWQGPNAGMEVDLEVEARKAMGAIACPERVFGKLSNIENTRLSVGLNLNI